MKGWTHSLAVDWGHWQRKSEAKMGAIQGTLGRIREEGLDGAAIREHGEKIPLMEFPKDVARFHRSWLRLERDYQMILWLDYKDRHPVTEKYQLMRKSRSAYYRLRDKALLAISMEMARN